MSPGNGLTEMKVGESGRKVYLRDEIVLSNEDVASASVRQRQGGPAIQIVLNETGREKLAEATSLNLNKPLAMLVNGRVLSAATIREPVFGDTAIITGNFTEEEATRIAEGIVWR
jgi:preprotein translocase subunit SecD